MVFQLLLLFDAGFPVSVQIRGLGNRASVWICSGRVIF